MSAARSWRVAVVAVGLALASVSAGIGCGGGSDNSNKAANKAAKEGAQTVSRTKVKVVEGLGRKGSFDPSAIYQRLSNGVVTITSLFGGSGGSGVLGAGSAAAEGSGFVIDDKGSIATNAHVITSGRSTSIKKARGVFVQFADGNQVPARIVGFDPNADVGLLKVNPKSLELVPLKLGNSSAVRVGDPVAAIGSPFGEEQSLSVGVVSATNRTIEALTQFQISGALQTDAAINRGNSGGPLLNAQGDVIGINSQIKSSGGGGEGVGFAVGVDTVKRSLAQLRSSGKVHYAFIGVSSQPLYPQLARRLKLPVDEGALVADVVKGGPAARAGIKGGGKEIRFQATLVKPGGDVITKINGRKVTTKHDLSELVTQYRAGDTVTLEVYRGGNRRNVSVKLAERPANVPQ
jgi:S1-C subfamily serine protease